MTQLTGSVAMVRTIPGEPNSDAEPWIKVDGHDWHCYKDHPELNNLPEIEYIPKDATPGIDVFMRCIRAGFRVIEGVALSADDLPK